MLINQIECQPFIDDTCLRTHARATAGACALFEMNSILDSSAVSSFSCHLSVVSLLRAWRRDSGDKHSFLILNFTRFARTVFKFLISRSFILSLRNFQDFYAGNWVSSGRGLRSWFSLPTTLQVSLPTTSANQLVSIATKKHFRKKISQWTSETALTVSYRVNAAVVNLSSSFSIFCRVINRWIIYSRNH